MSELTLVVQGTLDPCTAPTIFSHQQQSAYQPSHVAALLINPVVLHECCKVFPYVTLILPVQRPVTLTDGNIACTAPAKVFVVLLFIHITEILLS